MKASILFLLFCLPLLAANFYASPSATTGTGTLGDPWNLQVAITNTTIANGDTVWLRGGIYFPRDQQALGGTNASNATNSYAWNVAISGVTNNLKTFRSYTNEWAKIDRPWRMAGVKYIRFQDLEFYNSLKGYKPGLGYAYPATWHMFDDSLGGGNEWINCIVHDIGNGYSGSTAGQLISGCIFWYVGNSYWEHLVYPYVRNFTGNIVGWTSGSTIQIGTGVQTISSNLVWGTSITDYHADGTQQAEFLITEGITFSDNLVYEPLLNAQALYANGGSQIVTGNKLVARTPAYLEGSIAQTVTNNLLYMNGNSSAFYVLMRASATNGAWLVNSNAYYSIGPVHFSDNSVSRLFSEWKTQYPTLDTTSAAFDTTLPPDSVMVYPNSHQAKRAHIGIFNWTAANNVSVSLSGVLNTGDIYQLISAQNYGAGSIQSGVYNGTAISVPMTNLVVAPILYGTNYTYDGTAYALNIPAPTSPQFAAFVVLGSAATPAFKTIGNAKIGNGVF